MSKLIILILLLSSCYNAPDFVKPLNSVIMNQMPENGSPAYKQGWKDGCESGLASMTNGYYRTYYKFKNTPELLKDKDYYRAWKDLYTFCRHYAYGNIRSGNQRMRLQNSPLPSTFLGQESLLDYGFLNFWGPGNGEFFGNFEVKGVDNALNSTGVLDGWSGGNQGILNSNDGGACLFSGTFCQ